MLKVTIEISDVELGFLQEMVIRRMNQSSEILYNLPIRSSAHGYWAQENVRASNLLKTLRSGTVTRADHAPV